MARLLINVSAFINTASLYLLYAMWLPLYFSLRILLRPLLGRGRRNLWLTRMQLDSLSPVNYIGSYLLDKPLIWTTKYGLMLTIIKEEVLKYVMGLLEPYQRRLIHAKKGGIVIDIGANIGFYTLKFAREVGKDGLVVSLEPNPYAFELLNYNIRLNEIERRVRPIKLAAFDKSGLELSFYLEDKGQTPRHDGSVSTILKKGKLLFSAITTTVDELVGDSLHRIDIIKIDTEGAEPEILKGCIKTIERHRPMLIVEVHNFRVKDTIAAIRSMISNYSYDAVMVPRHRYESIGLDNEVTFTVIAYPRRPRN